MKEWNKYSVILYQYNNNVSLSVCQCSGWGRQFLVCHVSKEKKCPEKYCHLVRGIMKWGKNSVRSPSVQKIKDTALLDCIWVTIPNTKEVLMQKIKLRSISNQYLNTPLKEIKKKTWYVKCLPQHVATSYFNKVLWEDFTELGYKEF
jgi:hypothetical protein